MMLIEETAVPQSALPLAEFRAHLRLGTGFADDGIQDPVLESFLRAAMAAIEARTGKVLIRRAFSWTLTCWRDPAAQALPVAPVTQITRLVLRDRGEGEEVIAPDLYTLETDMQRPVLRPRGAVLPYIPSGGTAEIVFDAGYADSWGGLPADLAQAVLLLAAHYYEYRDETALSDGCMPFGVTALIERYRTVRLFAGGRS
ncbi:MAG TPA: head-tail connector protein [Roseovarius sp.]|nr:head-tail connector protein [Roseovarius sp.]